MWHITIKRERPWHYRRMRRSIKQSKAMASLSAPPSLLDCTTNMPGYDFRKGQSPASIGRPEPTGPWLMHRSLGPFSGPKASSQTPSLADFITTTSGSRFSIQRATNHAAAQNARTAQLWLAPRALRATCPARRWVSSSMIMVMVPVMVVMVMVPMMVVVTIMTEIPIFPPITLGLPPMVGAVVRRMSGVCRGSLHRDRGHHARGYG
jgi:hypothetical protein